ncbi:DMT family transporter [Candidatus Woesearchaeota archaeon]|nr:DMT family transporter [Candidatus Woesearchaeota archaeon]
METWLLYSVLALFMWGFWGFLPKVALSTVPPQSVLVWQGLGAAVCTILYYFVTSAPLQTGTVGITASIATGIFAFLGSLFFIFALSTGKAAIVVPLTALYPLITIVLAVAFLQESLSLQSAIGIFFALLAIVFLAH